MTPAEREAARIRDELEANLAPLLLAATAEGSGGAEPARASVAAAIEQASWATLAAVLALLKKGGRITRADEQRTLAEPTLSREIEDSASALADSVVSTAQAWGEDHRQHLAETSREPGADRAWANQASRSLATQTASQVAEDVAGTLAPMLGLGPWKKVWISRADSRVRKLHRALHGQPARTGKPFWTWPLQGASLARPGDPDAPLDQRIGCRCTLFYVPAAVADREVTDALAPADLDKSFDLVASATGEERTALIDLMEELAS